jgi:hypothetical protein
VLTVIGVHMLTCRVWRLEIDVEDDEMMTTRPTIFAS